MIIAYKDFWKHYFDFTGKSTRSNYWWVFVMNSIIWAVLIVAYVLSANVIPLSKSCSMLANTKRQPPKPAGKANDAIFMQAQWRGIRLFTKTVNGSCNI